MSILRFVMYILFRYYSKGKYEHNPYFSSLLFVVFLIYLHILQILTFFGQVDQLLPFNRDESEGVINWKAVIIVACIFLIVVYLVRPGDLKKLEYDAKKVKRGGIYLVIYAATSMILFFVLAWVF